MSEVNATAEVANLEEAQPGDWIKAEYVDGYGVSHPFEGEAWVDMDGAMIVGDTWILWAEEPRLRERVRIISITRKVTS